MKNQRFSFAKSLTSFMTRYQTWSWSTVVASIVICIMVIWLNARQNMLLNQAADVLTNLHVSRIELAKGFLYVSLSTNPDSPYSREEGLVLLNQATTSLEEIVADLDVVLTGKELAEFRQDLNTFQMRLEDFRTVKTPTPAMDTELRIAFHDLENQASAVDDQAHQQLNALRSRFNLQFAVVLGGAVILLTVISATSIRTERAKQRVDKALAESEAHYRLITDNIADVIWVMDPIAGKFTYVSPSVERLRGYTVEEVMAQPVSASMTPESLKVASEALERNLPAFIARGSGTETYVTEVEQTCKDGSTVKTEVTTTYLFNAQGKVEIIGISRDITERKRAEEKVQVALTKYQTLFNAFPLGITVADAAGNIIESNQMAEELLGISDDEQKQREIDGAEWHIIRPDGTPMPAEEFASVRALKEGRKVENVEMGIIKPDNSIAWINVTAAPLRVDGYGVVATYGDIGERKKMEEELHASRKLLQDIIDNTSALIYVFDTEGRFILINRPLEKLFGHTNSEMIGQTRAAFMPAEFAEQHRNNDLEIIRTGESRIFEEENLEPDGRHVYLTTKFPMFDAHGRIYATCGISTDMTALKQAEQKVREMEVQLQKLNDNIANGYTYQIDFGQHGELRKFLYISAGVEKLMNISAAQVIESWDAFTEFFLPDDNQQVAELEREAFANMTPFTAEVRFKHREGQIGWLILHSTPHKMANDHIVWDGVALDITERKRMEEELRRSNAELEQFAYIASHDLQEPLRTVAGMVQLLQQRYKSQLDERANEYIHLAVDASERMQQLINDLLDFSRVERKGRPFNAINMDHVLKLALANLQNAITESGAQITSDPLPTVVADSGQLTRVLQNLIGNAIKFRGEEPPKVHVSAEKIEKGWQFAVRDNGIGIDPQYFDRVFLIFQRLHTRSKYPGTGIGLALSKKIVERHGGKMWIESELKQGATFFFTIPERSSL